MADPILITRKFDAPHDLVYRAWTTPGLVGGAGFAAGLIKLDLIDEYRMFVTPVVMGGGTPYFPSAGVKLDMELVETRTFSSRVVYLRYRRVGKAG